MDQPNLFFDDLNHALRDLIAALGGAKRVGSNLWPEKTLSAATSYLANCTDANRPEKLSLDQIMWLLKKGRQQDCHVAINYICAAAGYAPPQTREPEDEKAQLMREYVAAEKEQAERARRIQSLDNGICA